METKQIKLTLKSAAPPLKKITNRFDDDSDDEGISNNLLLCNLILMQSTNSYQCLLI